MPNDPKLKDENQRKYYAEHGRPMLLDYVTKELEKKVSLHSLANAVVSILALTLFTLTC